MRIIAVHSPELARLASEPALADADVATVLRPDDAVGISIYDDERARIRM